MAFHPIELTTVSRAQDYSSVKHNEDNKGYLDQSLMVRQQDKNERKRSQEVNKGDHAMWQNKQPDAREKGSNSYSGDGGRNRKRTKEISQVVVKGNQGFDMKI